MLTSKDVATPYAHMYAAVGQVTRPLHLHVVGARRTQSASRN